MGIEIERKFLVIDEKWQSIKPQNGLPISQGYLYKSEEKTIRVRTKGTKGFLTIKGKTDGISRLEFEYEIPLSEAKELLNKFCPKRIEKTRYEIQIDGLIWEVDEFSQPNTGLVLAEVELSSEDQSFSLPAWIGEEVSDDPKYFNANML